MFPPHGVFPFFFPRQFNPPMCNAIAQKYQRHDAKLQNHFKPKARLAITPHHLSLWSYLRSSERRRLDPSPRSRSSEWRRWCLDGESTLFEPRDTTMGLWSGRLSCLSDSFFDRAAACFSQTSFDFLQISSICSCKASQHQRHV